MKTTPLLNINTDHFPIVFKAKIKLKAVIAKDNRSRIKFQKCSVQQRYAYNAHLKNTLAQSDNPIPSLPTVLSAAKDAAQEEIPQLHAKRNQSGISSELLELIRQRGEALLEYDVDRAQTLNRQIQKQKRKEKKEATLKSVSKDLDVLDRFLGLRNMKRGYHPIPYTQKGTKGKHVKVNNKAAGAATYFAKNI